MSKCLSCGQELIASPRYRYIEPFVPPKNYCEKHGYTYEQRRENDPDRDTGQPSTERPASDNQDRDIVHPSENAEVGADSTVNRVGPNEGSGPDEWCY